jgi:hypothetical protein
MKPENRVLLSRILETEISHATARHLMGTQKDNTQAYKKKWGYFVVASQ